MDKILPIHCFTFLRSVEQGRRSGIKNHPFLGCDEKVSLFGGVRKVFFGRNTCSSTHGNSLELRVP
jgi:hypothetical protein